MLGLLDPGEQKVVKSQTETGRKNEVLGRSQTVTEKDQTEAGGEVSR